MYGYIYKSSTPLEMRASLTMQLSFMPHPNSEPDIKESRSPHVPLGDWLFFFAFDSSYSGKTVGNGLHAQRQNPEVKVRGVDPTLAEVKERLERFNQVRWHQGIKEHIRLLGTKNFGTLLSKYFRKTVWSNQYISVNVTATQELLRSHSYQSMWQKVNFPCKKKKKHVCQDQKVRNEWQIARDDTSSFKVTLFVM